MAQQAVEQARLLLAWGILEERARDDGACMAERNSITHALEKGQHLKDLLPRNRKFRDGYQELEQKPVESLPMDLVHALAFTRLLAIVREALYKHEDTLYETVNGEQVNGRHLTEALLRHSIDMNMLVLELQSVGLHVANFKRVNRLRNAFKKQCARRRRIDAQKIIKTLNDLCIHDDAEFVQQVRYMTRQDITLEELLEDDLVERGGRPIAESTANLGQLLHVMQKAWFTVRGAPRDIGLEDVKQNVLKSIRVCEGALLNVHLAVAVVCPTELDNVTDLPDVGHLIAESVAALRGQQ